MLADSFFSLIHFFVNFYHHKTWRTELEEKKQSRGKRERQEDHRNPRKRERGHEIPAKR